MGSGKTTVGKRLAVLLNYGFIDTDLLFEQQQKMKIHKYFERYGEDSFRKLESKLLQGIDYAGNSVVSTGGGMPCYAGNMQYMRKTGITIYLQLNKVALVKRLEKTHNIRPSIKNMTHDELKTWIEEKLNERTNFYQQAHIIIDARSLSAEKLLKALNPYL